MNIAEYATPGPLTQLRELDPSALLGLPDDPTGICACVTPLVIQPGDARGLELPESRFASNQMRPAEVIIGAALALDPSPIATPREPKNRVVGTCRHFAVVACALLRHRSIPARVRCGFATYFQPGQSLDHWITEYWDGPGSRWIRIDSEVLGSDTLPVPEDLRPGEFLSGCEAWAAYRRGEVDGALFGVCGTENWGPAEIRGNVVKDLAAVNKVEMLPWDEWGRMTEAYDGRTGNDYDQLLDQIAAADATGDLEAMEALGDHADLRVPDELIL